MLDVVQFLFDNGASVTIVDDNGNTTITACNSGHLQLMQFLFEHGVSVTTVNNMGTTALSIASAIEAALHSGSLEIAEWLYSVGATDVSYLD